LSVHLVGFSGGQLSAEDVLGNGVCPFDSVQCCQPEARSC
jgi:hypothetical protein